MSIRTSSAICLLLILVIGGLFEQGLVAQNLYVGSNSSGQSTNFTSGTNSYGTTYVGYTSTDSSNTLTVANTNTLLKNSAALRIGEGGFSNSLVISNGGVVTTTGNTTIGNSKTANGNTVLVTGSNSLLSNSTTTIIGASGGSSNSLVISNGGTVIGGTISGTRIGYTSNSSYNSVIVTGVGSLLTNGGNIGMGNTTTASNNSLVISAGGKAIAGAGGIGQNGSYNSGLVTGAGSSLTFTISMYFGSSGSGNTLTVANGGLLSVGSTYSVISSNSTASNNNALITGAGSTWRNSGTLTVGGNGSGALTVANGASVIATNITIAANSGSGGTLNIGSLGGTDTAGTITAPIIAFGSGSGTLNFNQIDTTTLSSAISGAGSVNQLGRGTTILTRSNTYSGGTTINSGNVVTANTSALGSGGVTLNGGMLTAQSSLTVNALNWNSGIIALPNALSTQFITVTSALVLSMGSHQFSLNGLQPGPPVELLAAPNLTTANFSTNAFSATGVFGNYALVIMNNALFVEWISGATNQFSNFQQFAATPNQSQVAAALNQWSDSKLTPDKLLVLTTLSTLPPSQLPGAFDAISANFYQSLATTAFNLANAQNNDLVQRLYGLRVAGGGFSSSGFGDNPTIYEEPNDGKDVKNPVSSKNPVDILRPGADNHWGMFVDGNGIFARANSGNMLPTYNSQSGGVTTGLTYKWNESFGTGIYAGYEGSYGKYSGGSTLIDNAVNFGLFGTYGDPSGKGFYADALAGGGYHNYNVNRTIAFGSLNRTATSAPGAGELDSMVALGYNWKKGNWSFGPITSLQYTYLGVNSFSESGAQSLNLSNMGWNSSSMLSSVGGNIAYDWQANKKLMVVPQFNLAWQHEFLQNPYPINGDLDGVPVINTSATPNRDSLYTGVGVTVEFSKKWSAWTFYNASAGNQNLVSQNIFLGAGVRF